jgi:chromosome segregation ATPase
VSQAEQIQDLRIKQAETARDVDYLRKEVSETLTAIRDCTVTMQDLSKQFASYTAKHDETQKDIEESKTRINQQDSELQELRLFIKDEFNEIKSSNKDANTKLQDQVNEMRPAFELVKGLATRIILGVSTAAALIGTALLTIAPVIQKLIS